MPQHDAQVTHNVGPGSVGVEAVMRRGADWLLAQRNSDGGWGQRHGDKSNSLNTAEAILALLEAGANVDPGDYPIQQGRAFLVKYQSIAGIASGAWTRSVGAGAAAREVPDVLRTSLAVEALLRAGMAPTEDPIRRATTWMTSVRRDGGVGYDTAGDPAFLPTCMAMTAMVTACKSLEKSEQETFFDDYVAPLRDDVMARRNPDGSFGADGPLRAGHTIYGTLAMQKLRVCGFASHPTAEAEALTWLRTHPNEAMDLTEEEIVLDPTDPDANYSFLYMTDALLVRVAHAAVDSAEAGSELSRRALFEVWKRWTDDGGFQGNRVFTWSTAKCLLALKAAEHTERFPSLAPEPTPEGVVAVPNRSMFWGLLFAVFLGGVMLIILGSFSPLVMAFLIVVLLVALLAVGRLTEQGFISAMRAALGSAGSAPQ